MNVVNANLKYKEALTPLDLSKIQCIIVHHPAAVTYTPEQCHEDHLANGWAGAGYNEYIRKDGTVYIMRGDNVGAQCCSYNSISYGICCEGNYDIETEMPEAQFNALVERLKYHRQRLKNPVGIVPHSKLYPTSCPGKNFPTEKVLEAVNSLQENAGLEQAVQVLKLAGIINSPDYWLQNAVKGGQVSGEYAGLLIEKMADKLRG